MGKRKRGPGLTGLSGFVSKAFSKDAKAEVTDNQDTQHAHGPGAPSAATIHGTSTTISEGNVSTSNHSSSSKKRKLGSNDSGGRWVKKYDATGLVPHYKDVSEVPEHLQKYFNQRTRYLSLYSTPPGCLLDEEGWYSITPEMIANHIAERCRSDTIIDAFCGVGGNAIALAKTCQRVIAIDNDPTRLALARHNAQIYGVADHIEFILADFISFAKSYLASHASLASGDARKIDAIFLSPPWGGPSYLDGSTCPLKGNSDEDDGTKKTDAGYGHPPYSLASIKPIHGAELFHLSRKITKNIAYYLPRNTRMEEVSDLLRDSQTENGTELGKQSGQKEPEEMVEVEEAWTGTKLKAITCYFGGLASGQEVMF